MANGSLPREDTPAPGAIIDRLGPYLSDRRKARIEQVVAGRTDTVATVVEGLTNLGNISAVMRSAEALGFHRFHIVEAAGRFKTSARTTQGADKWLDITRWQDADACVAGLRGAGYSIVVTHLSDDAVPIDTIDFTQYDIIFLAGGWGAAYDLGYSEVLGRKISEAYADGSVIGGVCHGLLGLLLATDEEGKPLVRGRRITAVTDKQIEELGITITPQHPERELRAVGANFESATAFRDLFANHVVVDGRVVSGQNQNAGPEVANLMMKTAGGTRR